MKRFLTLLMAALTMAFLLWGCSSPKDASSSQAPPAAVKAVKLQSDAAKESKESQEGIVNTKLDGKYVSKNYMLAMLVNSDCVVSEGKDMIAISTPSQSTLLSIALIPGIQNLSATAKMFGNSILTSYENAQVGEISDGYLMGYRAKLIPFSWSQGEALAAVIVANQSLYVVNLNATAKTTDSEIKLMEQIISSMKIIEPVSVDKKSKKAKYQDPYATYQTIYYLSDYDYYDIESWYDLPYDYYAWYAGDYSAWADASYFQPDWDYYDDTDYWSWGWDGDDDWQFYDEYADYYDSAYYDNYEDYNDGFDSTDYDLWADENGVNPYDSDAGTVDEDGVNYEDSDAGSIDEDGVNYEDSDAGSVDEDGVNYEDSDAGE